MQIHISPRDVKLTAAIQAYVAQKIEGLEHFGLNLIGAHVALLVGLARRRPRWRVLAALVVPPLAPVWGWREMPARARTWAIACAAYAVVIALSQ